MAKEKITSARPGDTKSVRKANSKKQQLKVAKAGRVTAHALAAKDKSTVTGKPLTKSQKQAVKTAEKRADAQSAYRTYTGVNYGYKKEKLGAEKFLSETVKPVSKAVERKVARATNPGPKSAVITTKGKK